MAIRFRRATVFARMAGNDIAISMFFVDLFGGCLVSALQQRPRRHCPPRALDTPQWTFKTIGLWPEPNFCFVLTFVRVAKMDTWSPYGRMLPLQKLGLANVLLRDCTMQIFMANRRARKCNVNFPIFSGVKGMPSSFCSAECMQLNGSIPTKIPCSRVRDRHHCEAVIYNYMNS